MLAKIGVAVLAAVLGALILVAWADDKGAIMARCQMEAMKVPPKADAAAVAQDLFVLLCMRSEGYREIALDCDAPIEQTFSSEQCYQPATFRGRLIDWWSSISKID